MTRDEEAGHASARLDASRCGDFPPPSPRVDRRHYYALAEQHASELGPDVLTLQRDSEEDEDELVGKTPTAQRGLLLAPPRARLRGETDLEFYRRKQNSVVVRHVSDDAIVAVIEIVSRGNKSSTRAMRAFLDKAGQLLDKEIHLLIVDLHPPGRRDPNGMHREIWDEVSGQEYEPPPDKPLVAASYEAGIPLRAYVEEFAVGGALPEMPLFLMPGAHVSVPLETTYATAYATVPRRWRAVLDR